MKRNAALFTITALMLFAVSCTQDILQPVEKNNGQPLFNLNGESCLTECINEDSGDAFAVEYSATVSWGGSCQCNNSKTLTAKIWNTLTTIEYEFTITGHGSAFSPGNLQYYDEVTNTWVNAGSLSTSEPLRISRDLEDNWSACTVISEQWRQNGGGSPAVISEDSYSLIGACGCEDDFSAVLDCSGELKSLTVTYTAEDAGNYVIQGGLSAGTSIVNATSDAGFVRNESHPSSGGPSNVTRWEGSLESCEKVTIVIEYTGGNGIGSWTAKLGNETRGSSDSQPCN